MSERFMFNICTGTVDLVVEATILRVIGRGLALDGQANWFERVGGEMVAIHATRLAPEWAHLNEDAKP